MEKSTLELSVTEVQYQAPIAILHAEGQLDRSTFLGLIAKSREIYGNGQRNLILDLRDVTALRLAGLYALFSASLIFEGKEPPSPELGIRALRDMAEEVDRLHSRHVKLLSPPLAVETALSRAGFEVYANLFTALASFTN